MRLLEKKLSSETVYRGKIINLRVDRVELPNGLSTEREVVEHGGAVAVVPVDENNEVIMVSQYRHPAGKVLLEVPAGRLEEGEDPAACAARELREETGYEAREMRLLFSFYTTPGFTNEVICLYLARGLVYRGGSPDEDEFIRLRRVPLEKALEMVCRGEICDAKSIIGILAAGRETGILLK
ncbi:MAG: NUDIX hydrolase [Peptococcaceae bacterium]|nr:NUDIX hydrolase [Peptococcaceae bacterium]